MSDYKEEKSVDFSKSIGDILNKKKQTDENIFPSYHSNVNDLISIKAFFDHVKSSLTSWYEPLQYSSKSLQPEGKLA